MNNNYQILISKLDAFIRKYYKNRLLKGIIYSLGLLLASFIFFTFVEYFGQFNIVGRTILFYTFITISVYLFVSYILFPLAKLYKFGKVINHNQAAEIIGNHFDEVKDKLLNVLQLEHLLKHNNNQLLLASIDQKSTELNPIPFTNAVNLNDNKKYLKFLLIPLLLIVGVSIISPKIFTEGTKRLVNHDVYIAPLAPFQITINNKNLTVLKNKDYTLKLTIKGKQIPNKVYITNNNNQYVLNKVNKKTYTYAFKNVQENKPFKIYAAGFYTKEYELRVIPNPILTGFSLAITYPKYLLKPNETLQNTGDLIVPEGTKLKWNIQTEDADFLNFILKDSTYQLKPTAQHVRFSKTALNNINYAFVPANKFVAGGDTVKYTIQVIKDKYPTIIVEEKVDSININNVYFKGQISDDYGFTNLTFNYKILTKIDSLPNRNKLQSVKIPFTANINTQEYFHFWDRNKLHLRPGDEVEYYFKVWDNDGVNGHKSAKTTLKTFKTKTINERNTTTDNNNKNIKKNLSESIKEAKQLHKDLENFKKKLIEKKKLGWEDKQKLKELLAKQKELEKKVNAIQKQNQQNNQQQNEYKNNSEEILKKQEQLQKLFNDLMTDEMKKMMEKLQEMMDKLNKNNLQQELDKMDLSNKDLEKELDRSLALFKQMEFEQKLDEVKNKLQKLAKKQNDLADKTKNKKEKNEALKNKQDKLNKKFEDIKKDLSALEKLNKDLENPNEMKDTKKDQEEVSQNMKNSSEQLQNKKNKKSSQAQKSAAKKMEEMAQKIAAMQAQAQNNAEDMDALRQLLDNLVHLSFAQEDLMTRFKKIKRRSPEYVKITQEQQKLKDDAKMIEDSLFALSKRVVQLKSIINKEISAINNNMKKTIGYMAERLTPLAVSRQQYVMTSINNLALIFDEALQQMQKQAKGKPGKGSCSKPGGNGQPKPGMGQIKKMQQKLSEQLKAMEKALKEGKKPGKKGKGKGIGGQGMSESLAKMAAQQAKIRNALQNLKNNGAKGTNGMSKLMEENEKDIVNKRITQQTLNRQKQILTRLLESERAEREREWDDKRESKEGKNIENSNPKLFFEYNDKKEKEVDLIKTTPPNLNLFYKRKVTQYFQNLNK